MGESSSSKQASNWSKNAGHISQISEELKTAIDSLDESTEKLSVAEKGNNTDFMSSSTITHEVLHTPRVRRRSTGLVEIHQQIDKFETNRQKSVQVANLGDIRAQRKVCSSLHSASSSEKNTENSINAGSCINTTVGKKEKTNKEDGNTFGRRFRNIGRRHSLDVGRPVLSDEACGTRASSKPLAHNIVNNRSLVTSRRNSLAITENVLRQGNKVGNLTQQNGISGQAEYNAARRNSVDFVNGNLNMLHSLEEISFSNMSKDTHAPGGRHSEERYRERNNYPKRLAKLLLQCEKELPTSTLLEIKRLREERLENP